MVFAFERRWRPEWDSSIVDLKINRNDLVTMASIVEREARLPEERPVIAAVYYNRLRRGMLLQADPTVQYAIGHHVGRVLYKDLTIDSPYNTYVHKGLPPGPVASPGVASLAAAAHPANVPYLYFVASRDGHHEFRMTLEQHTDAVREVRATRPAKKPAVKMLAMATPARSTSSSATTKKAPVTTNARTKTTSKPVSRTTSSKTSVKAPSRATSKKSSGQTSRKRATETASASR
jgi:hypothetical protein